MSMMQETDVLVSEVGPRDGLQSITRITLTADKLRWIAARQIVVEALPGEPLYGPAPDAGPTKGFAPAAFVRRVHA